MVGDGSGPPVSAAALEGALAYSNMFSKNTVVAPANSPVGS